MTISDSPYNNDTFVCWLKNKLQSLLYRKLFDRKIIAYQVYFNEYNIRLVSLLQQAIRNIQVIRTRDRYRLSISDNLYYNNFNVSTICKIIDYGILNTKGTALFTETCKYMMENLQRLYDEYLLDLFF